MTLNLVALMIYMGVYIDKGIALVIPGLTPSTLGEIYPYSPSRVELQVAVGVFGAGFLLFTLMLKVAVPIIKGKFNMDSRGAVSTVAASPAKKGGKVKPAEEQATA